MDRFLTLEPVRATEYAALASARWIGRGDEKAADAAAVAAMRAALNTMPIDGTVVIGEGERDEAPMLYIGEKVGLGGTSVDIALDPLEGTTLTAQGNFNAMTVIALAPQGGFLAAPDVYMEKLAAGPDVPAEALSLKNSLATNLNNVADAKGVPLQDLVVCLLNRPRHAEQIAQIRALGCRIILIQDGDVSAVIATAQPESSIDVYIGTGGAPEGVLAAAALSCLGGTIQGRLLFRNDDEKQRALRWGVKDFDRVYSLRDLVPSDDVMFAATGVTDGPLLTGVKRIAGGVRTHSIIMRSKTGTVRRLTTDHNTLRKAELLRHHEAG
jgi:fructose-1,6-bisphosphatase II / sedoheptulose-1,7-bisphosphatase